MHKRSNSDEGYIDAESYGIKATSVYFRESFVTTTHFTLTMSIINFEVFRADTNTCIYFGYSQPALYSTVLIYVYHVAIHLVYMTRI